MEVAAQQPPGFVMAHERYTREWLEQQAVCGYLEVVAGGEDQVHSFALAPGVSGALAHPHELTTMAPMARMLAAAAAAAQWTRIADAARSGNGLSWREYGADMRESQGDINDPPLRMLLADAWLSAGLPDLRRRLDAGEPLRIADVGRSIMEEYARDAGFSSIEVLPVEHDAFRFYRLS